jgi:hypothetical protein
VLLPSLIDKKPRVIGGGLQLKVSEVRQKAPSAASPLKRRGPSDYGDDASSGGGGGRAALSGFAKLQANARNGPVTVTYDDEGEIVCVVRHFSARA